jgi:DNA-binding transcriptional regulator GbsR (MarR family)
MIDLGARGCHRLGLPRSVGQIYGLLFLSARAMSLDDIVQALDISKASASLGTRQLLAWGAIRQSWVLGERKDYFEVVEDVEAVVARAWRELARSGLNASRRRLQEMLTASEIEGNNGVLDREESKVVKERLGKLERMHQRLETMVALAEKML